MSLIPNRLGHRLGAVLLLLLLGVALATGSLVYFAFQRTQQNATARSQQGLEDLGRQLVLEVAESQARLTAVQLEQAARVGQELAQYFEQFKGLGIAVPTDVDSLARGDGGQLYDPNPQRRSDVWVPNYAPLDDLVLADIADSAALDALFAAVINLGPDLSPQDDFGAVAVFYHSVTQMARYYPPIGLHEIVPPDLNIETSLTALLPENNPQRAIYWTEPYEDDAGQGLLITASAPVYDGDVFRGRIGVDLSMARLIEKLNQTRPTPSGFAFYADRTGELLRTDSYETLLATLEDEPAGALALTLARMRDNQSAVDRVVLHGEDYFIAYAPLEPVGGSFAVAAPVSEITTEAAAITSAINREGNRTVAVVLSVTAAFFMAGLVGATWLNRRLILQPIDALLAGTRSVADGDLNVVIPARGRDEMSALAHSFNRMTADLRAQHDALRDEVRERQAVQDELHALFAAMTDIVLILDREGRYLRVPSTGAPAQLRPDSESLLGRRMHDLLPAEMADLYLSKIHEVLATRETRTFEYPFEVDGREMWFSAVASPFSDDAVVLVARDITALKETEQALRSSQERQLAMVNSVDAILWEASTDFTQGFTFVSEQAERLLGYPVESWLEQPGFWFDHIYKEDQDWCLHLCLTETAAGRDHDFEYRMVAADGRIVWLRDIVTVVLEEGRPVSLRGVMIDITELKHATSEIANREQQYRSIFEATSDGLAINDLETSVIISANPAFCRMHGYDDMVGMHPTAFIHPNSHHLFEQYVEAMHNGGEFRGRAQDVRSDGTVFDVEVSSRAFTYQGRPAVLGLVRDITEQLRSEQQYRLVFESTTDSLLIHAPDDLRVMDANAASSALFGYSRDELIGMSPAQLITGYDPDFVNAVTDGRPRSTRATGIRKDGTTFDLDATGVPFVFRGETHLLCVQRDVTEQVRTYQLLEQRVLERTREIERRREVAEGLRELLTVVNSGRNLDEMLDAVVVQCRRLLQSDASSILLPLEQEPDVLVTRAASGLAELHAHARLPIQSSAAGLAVTRQRPAAVYDVPRAYAATPRGDGRSVEVDDLGTHIRVAYLPALTSDEQARMQESFAATYRGFLAIPLASRDQVYGALTLNYHEARSFTEDEIALALAFADQASIAIENARLYEQAAERTREIERRQAVAEGLSELLAIVNSGRSLDEMLEAVVAQASLLLQSDTSGILLPLDETGEMLGVRAFSGSGGSYTLQQASVNRTATGLAFRLRRPSAVYDLATVYDPPPDDATEPSFEDRGSHVRVTYLPQTAEERERQQQYGRTYPAFLAVPLASRTTTYGVLRLDYRRPREFSDEEVALAMAFADQASIAIENARLYEQAAERTREIERRRAVAEGLRDLLAIVNSGRSLDEMLEAVVAQARRLLNSDASTILLPLPQDENTLAIRAYTGMTAQHARQQVPVGRSAAGLSFSLQRPATVYDLAHVFETSSLAPARDSEQPAYDDGQNHIRIQYLPEVVPDPEGRAFRQVYRGLLAVPLAGKEHAYGTLTLNYHEPREFSDDEIALAVAFADQAALALENASLAEQTSARSQELESLLGVTRAVTSTLDLSELVRLILDELKSVVDYRAGSLILMEGDDLVVHDLVVAGQDSAAMQARGLRFSRIDGLSVLDQPGHHPSLDFPCIHVAAFPEFWDCMSQGMPVIVDDALTQAGVIPGAYRVLMQDRLESPEFMRSWMAVPLAVRDRVIGYVGMSSDQPNYFTDKHARLARAFADHASIAIENARLYEQVQQAATLEERQRLARELHDAVTQTLFSTSLIAEVVPDLWQTRPELARQRLEDLRRLTRGALAEMRTLLVELRPGALTELPLSDLLRQLAEATAGRTSLKISLQVDGQAAAPLPGEVQVALYRIAQESINNIVRHAQAQQAILVLQYEQDGAVTLRISDDGKGFDPGAIPGGHLGVGIMRERAQSIDAGIQVTSAPGAGTSIEVTWRGTHHEPD